MFGLPTPPTAPLPSTEGRGAAGALWQIVTGLYTELTLKQPILLSNIGYITE